jgi:hypothetical protein
VPYLLICVAAIDARHLRAASRFITRDFFSRRQHFVGKLANQSPTKIANLLTSIDVDYPSNGQGDGGTTMRHKTELTASRLLTAVTGRLDIRQAAVLVLVWAGSTSVSAQEGKDYRGTQEQQVACTGDVFKLCWSEIPNVSRIVSCLQREKPRLSSGCRAVFEQNTRTVANRWHPRHQRIVASADQLQPVQYEHRAEVATAAPITVAAVENPHVASGAPVSSSLRLKEPRSKTTFHDVHVKGRMGRTGRVLGRHLAHLHASRCGVGLEAMSRHHHHMSKALKDRCLRRTVAGVRFRSRLGS